jgi:hypothetical protein
LCILNNTNFNIFYIPIKHKQAIDEFGMASIKNEKSYFMFNFTNEAKKVSLLCTKSTVWITLTVSIDNKVTVNQLGITID